MKQDLYIIKNPKTCLVSRGCWGYRLQNKTENRSCVLGKDEVGGSIPPSSSRKKHFHMEVLFLLYPLVRNACFMIKYMLRRRLFRFDKLVNYRRQSGGSN